MHYHRAYRHGSPEAHQSVVLGDVRKRPGYRSVSQPDHPLAGPSGRVYVHRVVLYARIGDGEHRCHWCATPVRWSLTPGEDYLQVDHLNGDHYDNRSENLVPACRRCNHTRAAQVRHDALVAAGLWSKNDTQARRRTARVEACL